MNTRSILFKLMVIVSCFRATNLSAEVKLPKLVSDGIVLQCDANVKIWGWASDGEKIFVHFIDSTYSTAANKNGEWEVVLSGLKAGGPYTMQINASNFSDLLIMNMFLQRQK
jgi:sialate O-acetylesterase